MARSDTIDITGIIRQWTPRKTTANVIHMTAIPHSGNECSGLCTLPCRHKGCWQCEEFLSHPKEMAREAKADLAALQREQSKAAFEATKSTKKPPGLLGKLPAQKSQDHQKATITRAALEVLAEKAGVRMDWNNGTPSFYDDGVIADREKRWVEAERKLLEEKVKKLEDIASQQAQGNLSAQAARSLAASATKSMDTMVSDIVSKKLQETLSEDIRRNEISVKERMKAEGASDADIEAAEKLFGWKPPEDDAKIDPSDLQMATHLARMDAELQSVSKFGDLLVGKHPKYDLGKNLKQLSEDMKHIGVMSPTVILHPSVYEDMATEDLLKDKFKKAINHVWFKGMKL